MSWLSHAAHSVSAPLKKAASVAVNTAAGFAGGGGIGGLAGAARGIYENTKTGSSEAITLRTGGQAFVTGAVADIAAGTVAAGAHALAGTGAAGATGFFGKGIAALKSGGVMGALARNSGSIAQGFAQFFGKAPAAAAGAVDSAGGVASDASTIYDRLKKNNPAIAGALGGAVGRYGSQLLNRGKDALGLNGSSTPAPTVNVSTAPADTAPNNTPLLLAGAGALMFLFLKKK